MSTFFLWLSLTENKYRAELGKHTSQSSSGLTSRSIHTNHQLAALKTSIHSCEAHQCVLKKWQKNWHVRAAFVMWIWVWLQVSESIDTGRYKASEVRYILLTWPYHLTTALIYLSDPFLCGGNKRIVLFSAADRADIHYSSAHGNTALFLSLFYTSLSLFQLLIRLQK